MYRASTTKSTLPASSFTISASAADLSGPCDGTWKKGMPKDRTSSAVLVWFEITMGIVTGSSPRRWRHSSSSRQWSRRRDEDRHPLRDGLIGERPLEPERRERLVARSASISGHRRGEVRAVEHDPLEERATDRIVGVLVEREDVAVVAGDQRADRRDDARPGRVRGRSGTRDRGAPRCGPSCRGLSCCAAAKPLAHSDVASRPPNV